MRHFSAAEWQKYKENCIDADLRWEMSSHLYQCDHCLAVYLTVITDIDLEIARNQLPEDFTARILAGLPRNPQPGSCPPQAKVVNKSRLLIYYGMAASLVLFLTASGFFDSLSSRIPARMAGMSFLEIRMGNGMPGNWSQGLVGQTTGWLDKFTNFEEVAKE